MRDISLQEAAVVGGGSDTMNARIANACEGRPDSPIGFAGFAGNEGVPTVTITVKCGDPCPPAHPTSSYAPGCGADIRS